MCLPKACAVLLSILVNTGIGAWCVSELNGEYKLFCLLFFVPAAASAGLCCARRGSLAYRAAAWLMILTGSAKLALALAFAVAAWAALADAASEGTTFH